VVGTFIYLQPVLAATMGALMGGPTPQGPWPWVSAAAIFTGVHLVTRRVPTG
jgi:drug/metabolite transporter (DMT)-like permease